MLPDNGGSGLPPALEPVSRQELTDYVKGQVLDVETEARLTRWVATGALVIAVIAFIRS